MARVASTSTAICAIRSASLANDASSRRRSRELDDHPLPVEVAGEIEQERLDPPFRAAVVRVQADRDRSSMVERRAGVDPERRDEQRVLDPEVRRGKAQRPAARIPGDDDPLDLERAAEERSGRTHVTGSREPADLRRRDAGNDRHDAGIEPQPLAQREVAASPAAEAERLPGAEHLGSDPEDIGLQEHLRREAGYGGRELDHKRVLDPEVRQQLEPALQGREQLDLVAKDLARVRVKGHDRRCQPGIDRRLDDGAMTDVDTVEGADRDRARPALQLAG